MKYKDWLDVWLEIYVKPSVKKQTYDRYRCIIAKHIAPKLGKCEITDLTAVILQKFVAMLINIYSSSTVNTIITLIKKSLHTATDIGLISTQQSDKIKRPKLIEKKVECFTMDEQKIIEKHILTQEKQTKLFGIVLTLYTGLRIGELLALKWDDIDLKKGLIYTWKTCRDEYMDGIYYKRIDVVKTESSRRVVPIPKQLLSYLKNMHENNSNEFVVSNKKVVSVRGYQKTFSALLQKLDLPHRGFHSLRHTFATRALESGMDVRTLSEILGHKNPMTTLKRYAHSMLEYKIEIMNRLGENLQISEFN